MGLRSKMYSILTSNNDKKAACKGIQTHIKDKVLKHENYKECLFKEEKRFDTIYQIANEEHNLLTIKKVKNSLSPFDKQLVCGHPLQTPIEVDALGATKVELVSLVRW